jgi:heme exporter protein B
MGFFSAAFRIALKDLKVELRRSYEIISILAFSVSSILICSFAWGGAITTSPEVTSAALWIIIFFTSVLTFTTSFTREMDRGTLGGLKTLPCSASSILLGKTLYAIVFLLLLICTMLPISFIFLNLRMLSRFIELLGVFILGCVDLAVAGSFISGLVMFSEGKTLLLSFLLFPVSVPVLIPSVLATVKTLDPTSVGTVIPEFRLLLAYLIIFLVIGNALFHFVIEE